MNGNLNKINKKSQPMVAGVILIVAIISVAFFVILNLSYFLIAFEASPIDGASVKQILIDYRHLLSYLQNPLVRELKFNYLSMSDSGSNHFTDVRNLFLLNNLVMLMSVPLTIWSLRREKRNQQLWKLLIPLQTEYYIFPVLAVSLGLNFDVSFIKFHELVFTNQDWQFSPIKDPIINVLTESIFFQLSLGLFFLIEITMCLLYQLIKKAALKP